MLNKTNTTLAVLLACLTTMTPVVRAEILTYGVSGYIDWVENITDLPVEETFPIGMPWEVTYTFDSTVPNLDEPTPPGDPGRRYFFNVDEATSGRIFEMKIRLGDTLYEQIAQPEGRSGQFWIVNGEPGKQEAIFLVGGANFPAINGIEIPFVNVQFRNLKEHTDLHSTIGIDYQPDLEKYWTKEFYIWAPDRLEPWTPWPEGSYNISGRAEHFFVIPEPSTFLVIALGMLSMTHRSSLNLRCFARLGRP